MIAGGKTVGQVCQSLEISEQTLHRWRQQYGGMKSEEAKRLQELDEENKRLKKLLAEAQARQGDPEGSPSGKLLSPARRRRAVAQVQSSLGVSERRACQTLEQPRSTQRYAPRADEEEQRLLGRMLELVREHPRYGYRFITALLRREGWSVNRKRVHRLWRQ